MRQGLTMIALVSLFSVMVVVGAAAPQARAGGTDTYCSSCTIGNVPAVSYDAHFTSNHSSTFQAKKQQIYYFLIDTAKCSVGSTVRVLGLNSICKWDIVAYTARCHLLNDGTVTAICWADWNVLRCYTFPDCNIADAANWMRDLATSDALSDVRSGSRSSAATSIVDPDTAAWLRSEDAASRTPQIGLHLFAASRQLGKLPSGEAVYVVPTTMDRLCVVVAMWAESCGERLSRHAPVTFTVADDRAGRSVAYGVARDDVKSVSFTVDGRPVTVEVSSNFFVFRGSRGETAADFSAPRVTFADGTTVLAQ